MNISCAGVVKKTIVNTVFSLRTARVLIVFFGKLLFYNKNIFDLALIRKGALIGDRLGYRDN